MRDEKSMEETSEEAKELDLRTILFSFRKRWKWLTHGFLIGLIFMFLISDFVLPRKYTSSVSLYVNNSQQQKTNEDRVDVGDLSASQKLVDTYIVILENDQVLQEVCGRLSQTMTVEGLKNVISMESVNDTEVLQISAETTNAEFSAEICNTIAEVAPNVLQRVVKAGSVEIIGKATPATKKSSPSVVKNSVIGAFIGLIVMIIAALTAETLDTTVKGEEDIKRRLDIPVLGEIPHIEN